MQELSPMALEFPLFLGEMDPVVEIYTGDLTFSQENSSRTLPGQIFYSFYPFPAYRFKVEGIPDQNIPKTGKTCVTVENDKSIVNALITSRKVSFGGVSSFHGIVLPTSQSDICGNVQRGTVARILFAIPNLPDLWGTETEYPNGVFATSRNVAADEHWKVTIDKVRPKSLIFDTLLNDSGYALTHVGEVVHADRKSIDLAESQVILDGIAYFNSFATGRWTGPVLVACYDSVAQPVYRIPSNYQVDVFRPRTSWVGQNFREEYSRAFRGFLKKWRDDFWRTILTNAVSVYIESNKQAGGAEGALVITQTAFELLASAILVETDSWLSAHAEKDLPAGDKLRLLLRWAGIPTVIPNGLDQLATKSKEFNWADGPQAFTEIRNKIVHPTRTNRKKATNFRGPLLYDAWRLGLWYLELLILRICSYDWYYMDRTRQNSGPVLVPWAKAGE